MQIKKIILRVTFILLGALSFEIAADPALANIYPTALF